MKHFLAFAAIVFWATFVMAGPAAAKHTRQKPHPANSAAAPAEAEPGAKVIHYGEKDVVKLNTKVRFTTLIVLPQHEKILDFTCGDKEFWIVNGNQNFAYVKPAKEGTMTNLNLITSAGTIYSFILVEVSHLAGSEPDLKVFVQPKEESMITAPEKAPTFVPADELEARRQQLQYAKEETQRIKAATDAIVERELAKKMMDLQFSYRFQPEKKPFHVEAIYHDKAFTYIRAKPDEIPSLYELRDGKPNLVNFQYKDGVYVADKVIDRGYLAIGKERLYFFLKGE
jgi:type IV secretory pathway VirB9-like protein